MWVAIALASLAIIIILVLCVPLDLALRADIYEKTKLRFKLVWLFGLVSKDINREKKAPTKEKATKEKQKDEEENCR